MYRIDRNNYHLKPKNSTIYTPSEVSEFIFNLLKDKIINGVILDPCSGTGSLLKPWFKHCYEIYGIDIKANKSGKWWTEETPHKIADFFSLTPQEIANWPPLRKNPNLILYNPPFNGYGNKLGSEVWLDKIIELFGKKIPLVLFTPMGFLLNSKKQGKRWSKFINDHYPPISSIISLPRDIFPGIEFHSEILIFNIPHLQPHYFYHEIQI